MSRLNLALGAVFGLALGCSNTLDEARLVWADGDGDFAEAEQLYQEASSDPKLQQTAEEELFEVYVAKAKAERRERPGKAVKYYRKALELRPDDSETIVELTRALRELGLFEEALNTIRKSAKDPDCRSCRRMLAVLLIGRADNYVRAQQWAEAEQDYVAALEILPDTAVALAITRSRVARGDVQAAAKALHRAVDLIGPQDADGRRQFLELRRSIALLAVSKRVTEVVDPLISLAPVGVTGAEQLGFALEIALAFRDAGESDEAVRRVSKLVSDAQTGRLKIDASRLSQLRDRLATLHVGRAAQRLASDDVDGADEDLKQALVLRPGDRSLALQRVLVTAGKGQLSQASASLAKIETTTKDHDKVAAILAALEVERAVGSGRFGDARQALARARESSPDLPEVHIAAAQLLAVTAVSGVSSRDRADLRSNGLVQFPTGRVTRVGEALSEIDWAKQQIEGLGPTYPYRAPGTDRRVETLVRTIGEFFPYKVTFNGEPTAVLVLRNSGATSLRVAVRGGGLSTTLEIPPGGSREVTVPEPGVVRLRRNGQMSVFVSEPFTKVQLGL